MQLVILTAETLTHLRHRPRPRKAPIPRWTTVRFCKGVPAAAHVVSVRIFEFWYNRAFRAEGRGSLPRSLPAWKDQRDDMYYFGHNTEVGLPRQMGYSDTPSQARLEPDEIEGTSANFNEGSRLVRE
jgi:hypothetical protein